MSAAAETVQEAIERLSRRDSTLDWIILHFKQHTDAEVAEMVDCLLAHPDLVTSVYLGGNRLTDEMGVKLARYVTASSTLQGLDLSSNRLGEASYLALAAALRVNTSLQHLYLFGNEAEDESRIGVEFVSALRINPSRPTDSVWLLYSGSDEFSSDEFSGLQAVAEELGHPTMQLLLCAQLDHFTFQTTKH